MRLTYVTRSFLDYRIPVLEELHRSLDGQFNFIYSADYVPERCHQRLQNSLGPAAIGLRGERRIGPNETAGFANRTLRIVYQPGLIRHIGETAPDVLVGDGFFQWTGAALWYRATRRVGLVVTYERTFHTERHAQKVRTLYRKAVMRWVDAMAVNGELSKEYSIFLGMDGNKITTGQMTADSHVLAEQAAAVTDAQKFEIRQAWGSPDVAMVTVGRLNDRKGITELLNGWHLLEKNRPGNWRLIIIGDGPNRAALENQVSEKGLNGVIFAGHVDYNNIAPFYAAADVLVMPTLEDNWSLVVPEAMACSLPILCSIYNGCFPELIEEDSNGWTFDPHDAQDTEARLAHCIEQRNKLPSFGERSREIVSTQTPARAADAIIGAAQIAISGTRKDQA